jgi:hypothetical protein
MILLEQVSQGRQKISITDPLRRVISRNQKIKKYAKVFRVSTLSGYTFGGK